MFYQQNSTYSLLPYYTNFNSQLHRRHHNLRGVPTAVPIVTRGNLPKHQFFVESSTINQASLVAEVYDLTDTLVLTLAPTLFNYYRYDTGTIIVYDRNTVAATNVLCGFYYLKVMAGKETLYSEAFQVVDLSDNSDWWKLTYSGAKDTSDGFLFSRGFEAYTLFKAYLGTPEIRQEPEDIINGRNKSVRKFDSIKRRPVLKIPDCPPYFEHTLRHMELDKLTVTLTNLETDEVQTIEQIEIAMEEQAGSEPLKIALLSWIEKDDVYRGYRENASITVVFESSGN